MLLSASIYVVITGSISSSLMAEEYSISFIHTHTHTHIFFTQSSIKGQFGCFLGHYEQYCNEHRGVYILTNKCFQILGVDTQQRGCWAHGHSVLSFWRSGPTVFHSACTTWESHRQESETGLLFVPIDKNDPKMFFIIFELFHNLFNFD